MKSRMLKLAMCLAVGLSGCAVTQRVAMRRCPTVYASLVDFSLTLTGMALGVLAYNNGDTPRTVVLTGATLGIATSSNLSECHK